VAIDVAVTCVVYYKAGGRISEGFGTTWWEKSSGREREWRQTGLYLINGRGEEAFKETQRGRVGTLEDTFKRWYLFRMLANRRCGLERRGPKNAGRPSNYVWKAYIES
jgi:hypothetical protein